MPVGKSKDPQDDAHRSLGRRHLEQAGDLAVNAARCRRHLRASGLSPKTETTYLEGVANLETLPRSRGMPNSLEGMSREHLEEWLIHINNSSACDLLRAALRSMRAAPPG